VNGAVALTVSNVDRTVTDRPDAADGTPPVNRSGAAGDGATESVCNIIGEPPEGPEAGCFVGEATTHMCNDAATVTSPTARPNRGQNGAGVTATARDSGTAGVNGVDSDEFACDDCMGTADVRPLQSAHPGSAGRKAAAVRCAVPNQRKHLPIRQPADAEGTRYLRSVSSWM
jgi:hypothetical protein